MRVSTLVLGIALGSNDEEGSCLIQREELSETQIPSIHNIEGPWLWDEDSEHVDVVQLAVGDMDEAWDIASYIEQGMKFDG
jgi:hypothetical protein